MLKSMTGHGESRAEGDGFEISIEVRSVNNRFLRVVSKITDNLAFMQPALEEEVRRQIVRGSVFLAVRFQPTSSADFFDIDGSVLRKYYLQLRVLADEMGTDEEILLKDLLRLPGVTRTDEQTVRDRESVQEIALSCLGHALDRLQAMRNREGQNLQAEFEGRSRHLREVLGQVRQLAPRAVQEYQRRLEDRLNQAIAQHKVTLSPEDLIKEVAILADRSDISEEIARLDSHLTQFCECLADGSSVGRKLEFIIQEMFREANTMASKSVLSELNRLLVDYKTELDRLKEQVQNIE